MTEIVKYSVNAGVATIELSRPEKYNSVNRDLALSCQHFLDEAATDKSVRVIFLTAKGKAFCAGQDLREAMQGDLDIKKIVREHYNALITRIRSIEKPVVCGVNGVAAGAGASIALACDITIATHSAIFVQAFSKIGLIPDSAGTYYLPRLVGMQKAAGLMFLADNISADEAEKMNLIFKAVDDAVFEEECNKILLRLAAMPTVGIGLTKRLLNATWNNSLQEQLDMEMNVQFEATQTYDFKEGVIAFLQKRKPEFKGE